MKNFSWGFIYDSKRSATSIRRSCSCLLSSKCCFPIPFALNATTLRGLWTLVAIEIQFYDCFSYSHYFFFSDSVPLTCHNLLYDSHNSERYPETTLQYTSPRLTGLAACSLISSVVPIWACWGCGCRSPCNAAAKEIAGVSYLEENCLPIGFFAMEAFCIFLLCSSSFALLQLRQQWVECSLLFLGHSLWRWLPLHHTQREGCLQVSHTWWNFWQLQQCINPPKAHSKSESELFYNWWPICQYVLALSPSGTTTRFWL